MDFRQKDIVKTEKKFQLKKKEETSSVYINTTRIFRTAHVYQFSN